MRLGEGRTDDRTIIKASAGECPTLGTVTSLGLVERMVLNTQDSF